MTGEDKNAIAALDRDARKRIAANIDRLRIASGVSLIFLADAAQVGRGTMSRILSGRVNATLQSLVRVAYALNVDIGDLFTRVNGASTPTLQRGRPRTKRRSPTRSPSRR